MRSCSAPSWTPSWSAAGPSRPATPADDEPFLQLRDDRKLKKGSEKGLSTN